MIEEKKKLEQERNVIILLLTGLMLLAILYNQFMIHTIFTLCCGMVILMIPKGRENLFLSLGLGLSVIGDYFMAHKQQEDHYLIFGIIFFLLAHLMFCLHFIKHGKRTKQAISLGSILLIGYFIYFVTQLNPNILENSLKMAVIAYIFVSILSLTLSTRICYKGLPKVFIVLGIGLITFSDTLIAQNTFVGHIPLSVLIIPTYLGCHYCLTIGTLLHQEV